MVIPQRIKIYIAVVTLSGVLALSLALLFFQPVGTWQGAVLAIALAFSIGVATAYPIKVSPKTHFNTATAPIFAAVLLLHPAIAVLVSVAGTVLAEIPLKNLKRKWFNILFTSGATAVEVGIAGSVFHLLGGHQAVSASLVSYHSLWAVPAVAAIQYLMNTGLVSLGISLQLSLNPRKLWLKQLKERADGRYCPVLPGLSGSAACCSVAVGNGGDGGAGGHCLPCY